MTSRVYVISILCTTFFKHNIEDIRRAWSLKISVCLYCTVIVLIHVNLLSLKIKQLPLTQAQPTMLAFTSIFDIVNYIVPLSQNEWHCALKHAKSSLVARNSTILVRPSILSSECRGLHNLTCEIFLSHTTQVAHCLKAEEVGHH